MKKILLLLVGLLFVGAVSARDPQGSSSAVRVAATSVTSTSPGLKTRVKNALRVVAHPVKTYKKWRASKRNSKKTDSAKAASLATPSSAGGAVPAGAVGQPVDDKPGAVAPAPEAAARVKNLLQNEGKSGASGASDAAQNRRQLVHAEPRLDAVFQALQKTDNLKGIDSKAIQDLDAFMRGLVPLAQALQKAGNRVVAGRLRSLAHTTPEQMAEFSKAIDTAYNQTALEREWVQLTIGLALGKPFGELTGLHGFRGSAARRNAQAGTSEAVWSAVGTVLQNAGHVWDEGTLGTRDALQKSVNKLREISNSGKSANEKAADAFLYFSELFASLERAKEVLNKGLAELGACPADAAKKAEWNNKRNKLFVKYQQASPVAYWFGGTHPGVAARGDLHKLFAATQVQAVGCESASKARAKVSGVLADASKAAGLESARKASEILTGSNQTFDRAMQLTRSQLSDAHETTAQGLLSLSKAFPVVTQSAGGVLQHSASTDPLGDVLLQHLGDDPAAGLKTLRQHAQAFPATIAALAEQEKSAGAGSGASKKAQSVANDLTKADAHGYDAPDWLRLIVGDTVGGVAARVPTYVLAGLLVELGVKGKRSALAKMIRWFGRKPRVRGLGIGLGLGLGLPLVVLAMIYTIGVKKGDLGDSPIDSLRWGAEIVDSALSTNLWAPRSNPSSAA